MTVEVARNGISARGPVVGRGLPPFADGTDAVRDWVWHGAEVRSVIRDLPYAGHIVVLLPDTRGRIRRAEWKGETLTVETESTAAAETMELQVNIVESGRTSMVGSSRPEETTQWQIARTASGVHVFLVHDDGTLLSTVYLNRGEHYKAHAGELSLDERTRSELSIGESDQIEYKPFIESGDNKEWEIVETIVAFLNTGGGRIYIGVNNDGIPYSENTLRKVGKGDVEQSIATLTSRISELIRDRVKPVPRFALHAVTIAGSRVIVVDIPPGDERPYATLKNDVYIRKGSSNFKPDPLTELGLLFRKRPKPGAATQATDEVSMSIHPTPGLIPPTG